MSELLKILEHVGYIKIKGIVDVLLKYGVVLVITGVLSGIFKAETWITIFVFILAALFILFAFYYYAWFVKRNPDYLRSETYQLKKHSLELLGDKDNVDNPNIHNVPLILNPSDKTKSVKS